MRGAGISSQPLATAQRWAPPSRMSPTPLQARTEASRAGGFPVAGFTLGRGKCFDRSDCAL
eukprot:6250245-Alexandrium_andersonii.AAC.1